MNFSLKQIADAVAEHRDAERKPSEKERSRIAERARMLRDQGVICSSCSPTPGKSKGKTVWYTFSDAVAAGVLLQMSLNGYSPKALKSIAKKIHDFTDPRWPSLVERHADQIRDGSDLYLRLDFLINGIEAGIGQRSIQNDGIKEYVTLTAIIRLNTIAEPMVRTMDSEG